MSSNSRDQGWSAPPEGILLRILSHLEQHDRSTAASVNSHWAKETAVTTNHILTAPRRRRAVRSLHQYLGRHGQHVTSLRFDSIRVKNEAVSQAFLHKQLPCPNLLQLDLEGVGMQLLPSGGTPHLLQAATALTRLNMEISQEVPRFEPSLAVLTAAPQLRSLHMSISRLRTEADTPADAQDSMDGALLAELPHLTQLKLVGPLRITTLRHISCLTALRELHIQLDYQVAEAANNSASQEHSQQQQQPVLRHLTKLQLGAPGLPITSSIYIYPWLADLPALLDAEFTTAVMTPQAICAAPNLTKLELVRTMIAGGSSGLKDFFTSVGSLPELKVCNLGMHATNAKVPLDACNLLTAGSKLTQLQLSGLRVPQGGWQHAFPANVQLGLTSLELTDMTAARGALISSEDLQRLVQCCPHLNNLSLEQGAHQALELQPLVQLSGLESLSLGGFLQGGDAPGRAAVWTQAVSRLSQLPALKRLEFLPPDIMARPEMLQLTVLTRLTWLHMNLYQDCEQLLLPEGPPDGEIWYQLLLASLDDSACRDILLQQKAAVLQQLQEGGQDPRPVQLALQEAHARAHLLRVQRRFERHLRAVTRKYIWGQHQRH